LYYLSLRIVLVAILGVVDVSGGLNLYIHEKFLYIFELDIENEKLEKVSPLSEVDDYNSE
jgi:hypothetical protein